jgi:hypothetical protein
LIKNQDGLLFWSPESYLLSRKLSGRTGKQAILGLAIAMLAQFQNVGRLPGFVDRGFFWKWVPLLSLG